MSGRCEAPTCGRTLTEGSGREPYDYLDHQFCDRTCAARWAHDELLSVRELARCASIYRGGLHRIVGLLNRKARAYQIARETLNTAHEKGT